MSGTNSFSHITTLSLPSSYTLLPKSINPRMDIIALTRALPVTFAPPRRMLPGGGGGGGGWTAREDRKEREINARGRVAVGVWRLEGGGGAVVDGYGSASVAGQVGIGAGGGGGGGGGGNGSVWEVQLGGGEVVDVAWAPEGDVLSVLLQGKTSDPSSSKIKLRLVHLDVQDGSIIQAMDVRVVDVDVDVDVGDAAGVDPTGRRRRRKQDGVAMRWWKTEAEWPADENGSGGMIMDSIPKPTPVAPFTSLAQEQMTSVNASASSLPDHGSPPHMDLEQFPIALQPVGPHILQINLPSGQTIDLVGGAFPIPFSCPLVPPTPPRRAEKSSNLPSAVQPKLPKTSLSQAYGHDPVVRSLPIPVLRLAKSATSARNMLDLVYRGIVVCEMTWREGMAKPAMLWREELEAEGRKHGANFEATYADLTRLLLIGRSGAATSRYMGGILTNNGLSSWEKMHDKAVQRMHKVLTQSVFPACERLLLRLEDLISWGMDKATFGLNLPEDQLEKCIAWVRYLAMRTLELDREMNEESKRFHEFAKWAKYEIAKNTAATDAEEDVQVPSTHDVVAVCDFLEHGFQGSRLERYFLTIDELIDYDWPKPRLPKPRTTRPLHVVLAESLSSARSNAPSPLINSPRDGQESITSPSLLSPSTSREKGTFHMVDSDSSPDKTRDADGAPAAATKSTARHSAALWAIACQVQDRVEVAYLAAAERPPSWSPSNRVVVHPDRTQDCWQENDKDYWLARMENEGLSLRVVHVVADRGSDAAHLTIHSLAAENSRILALMFFDEHELLMIIESQSLRSLVTISYPLLQGDMHLGSSVTLAKEQAFCADVELRSMELCRSRPLKKPLPTRGDQIEIVSIAANGRDGRRIACIAMGDRREMEVFDMGVDDDEDDRAEAMDISGTFEVDVVDEVVDSGGA